MEELLVDGYNIIHSWPVFKKILPLELARDKLKELMSAYADTSGVQVVIVFDGAGEKETILPGNPKIIFTRRSQSADSYIEKLVYESSQRAKIRVASDDVLHQQLVFGMGGTCISSKGLEDLVGHKLKELREEISNLNKKFKTTGNR
ncbi:MAG: NYN domain-containing protein [Candidatus Omnitrophota bacterium]